MKPVRLGDRGSAVEDIQRRLRILGYDLGPTGIDGVFHELTAKAVTAFQVSSRLNADGLVGDDTWSALVDATFTLGDRMLYLRMPHFHGRDVAVLQEALNSLGFACGDLDSIFGTFTEHAVREFQLNAGLLPDGIAGHDTIRALVALKHIWEGKEPRSHSAARTAPVRLCDALSRTRLGVGGLDAAGRIIAERVANLASAANPETKLEAVGDDHIGGGDFSAVLRICAYGMPSAMSGRPVVRMDTPEALAARLLTAAASLRGECPEIVVELEDNSDDDELAQQRAAVRLLDAICFVFD